MKEKKLTSFEAFGTICGIIEQKANHQAQKKIAFSLSPVDKIYSLDTMQIPSQTVKLTRQQVSAFCNLLLDRVIVLRNFAVEALPLFSPDK